jgi:F1F0 ATPase subunit 2
MMSELWILAPPLTAGLLLGLFFFGGLWWTVSRGVSVRRPALWFLGSLLVRTGVTLGGFYFAARDSWQRWLLCLLGFVLARIVVQWLTRSGGTSYAPQSR